ncbi:hypothetical protein M1403_03210 [Patescibacteria group bacterium]|nr:hypothetical protein [Patescibacteria group bacterium]
MTEHMFPSELGDGSPAPEWADYLHVAAKHPRETIFVALTTITACIGLYEAFTILSYIAGGQSPLPGKQP